MTCYLKNLKPVLEKAGHPKLTKNQRNEVDRAVRTLTGATGKCPEVWQVVKVWLQDPQQEDQLIKEIRAKLEEPCQ